MINSFNKIRFQQDEKKTIYFVSIEYCKYRKYNIKCNDVII